MERGRWILTWIVGTAAGLVALGCCWALDSPTFEVTGAAIEEEGKESVGARASEEPGIEICEVEIGTVKVIESEMIEVEATTTEDSTAGWEMVCEPMAEVEVVRGIEEAASKLEIAREAEKEVERRMPSEVIGTRSTDADDWDERADEGRVWVDEICWAEVDVIGWAELVVMSWEDAGSERANDDWVLIGCSADVVEASSDEVEEVNIKSEEESGTVLQGEAGGEGRLARWELISRGLGSI
jgi:hypothetical protein